MQQRLRSAPQPLVVLAALAISAASCSQPAASSNPRAPQNLTNPVQKLNLEYARPPVVGTDVHVTATGWPAGKSVELVWGTVNGGWVVEDYYHFRGKKYKETSSPLGRFAVDGNGRLDAHFTIPEDYGGVHEIIAKIDGKPIAQNGIEVTQTFEMAPTTGPIGTPIELKVKGLGWRTMESTWVVNWDNKEIGWVSAANTRGSSTARFRATGPVGDHVIKVYTGWQGQGYLNYEQSPVAHLPRPEMTFRTTPGNASARPAFVEPYQPQPVPRVDVRIPNAKVALSPTQGPVGSRAILRGEGLPRGATLQVVWQTAVGSRVAEAGFAPKDDVVASPKVSGDGRFELPLTIPDDLGGLHGVAVRNGDQLIAQAHFVIETSIVSITPTSGPVGTPVTIHLKGVGWTEYDNIYVATYDNAYMGYACGFNSHGDVVVNFTASGAPGRHLIDFYPGIYQGPTTEPQLLYRTPQLTYADDHPGNKIPALRFAFDVTPGSVKSAPRATR